MAIRQSMCTVSHTQYALSKGIMLTVTAFIRRKQMKGVYKEFGLAKEVWLLFMVSGR